VDVSDTIEARPYSARQAPLLRRRPSTIIDAAESFHPVSSMRFYGGGEGHIIGAGAIGSAISKLMTGATRAVVLVDEDWATSAVAAVELDDDNSSDSWLRWAEATRTALQKARYEDKTASSAAARLRVERLAAIQAVLGLSTLDLARVIGITRQALYKWLDATKDMKLQEATRDRLAAVERVAKRWRERSPAPLVSVAQEPLANGGTVLALMVGENFDEAAVVGACNELLAKLQGKPKSRSQKLADAGFKRRPSARSLPSED
jgi:DNA-binding transcriptional regulator YiaG